ncbi:PE family protein [Mycobacterium basiliense]|uniref:PE family protein n=1 Tax=Mycobacterium basiliense TaxID=2094119 RepID=A0A447GE44_9MYCO|nr:PE family protein [Mycobacterium basiliense]VDM88725.1 PE family protein [Mycobacterium basiliense]
MSFVSTVPDMVTAAAGDLAGIRSALGEATAAAAIPTTEVAAAAADEISLAVSRLFGSFAQDFQLVSAQAAAFHAEFVALLNTGAGAYVSAELVNAQQTLINLINAPAQALLGYPLIDVGAATPSQVVPVVPAVGAAVGGAVGGVTATAGAGVATATGAVTDAGAAVAVAAPATLTAAQGSAASLLRIPASLETAAGSALSVSGVSGALQALGVSTPALLQSSAAAAAPAATVGGAYQDLFTNTWANLQSLGATWDADPAPFLSQFLDNQLVYANTIGTSLSSAAQDFGAGLVALPSAYQAAFQALAAGDVTGAVETLGKGYLNLVFTGFDYSNVPVVTINGALGDLLPIVGIPGLISQNMTNVLVTLTDTSILANISLLDPSFTTGLPLTLALDAIGAPIVTGQAALQSATTFINAVQTGDIGGAVGALIDAPAVIANGFLNGEATITLDLPTDLFTFPGFTTESLTSDIPVGGILTPLQPVQATAVLKPIVGPPIQQTVQLGGTQFGGIIPGLLNGSAQLANAIKLS